MDLIELHVQGKQAHWNIVGTNFRDLHLQLDEIIDAARGFADDLAERMRALHALPDGRSSTVSKSTALAEFPKGLINTKDAIERIVAALEAAVGTMRKVHDEVDEEDPTTGGPAARVHRQVRAVRLDGECRDHAGHGQRDHAGQQVGTGSRGPPKYSARRRVSPGAGRCV